MITTFFKNLVMDNLFHTAASAMLPAKYYLAWSPTSPSDNGSGFTEPLASTGYSRVELAGLTNATDGVITNSTKLTFAESTANQGKTLSYGVYDAPSEGNLLMYNEIIEDDRKTIEKGTTFYVKPNEAKFTLKGI